MTVFDAVKRVTPWRIRLLSRKLKRFVRETRDARLSVREVFTKIYEDNEWGGNPGEFYSGPGSSVEAAKPYTDAVIQFIRRSGITSVIDIGCGDFRVGQVIAGSGVNYTGVDIVEPLISRNRSLFGSDTIHFLVGNVSDDDLPDADLCLVREVFQHLSNDEIVRALKRLQKYRYLIVTDHQPPPGQSFVPNKDKPHGRDIRLFSNSALVFDKPPFSQKSVEIFLDVLSPNILLDEREHLRSFLISNPR
jgi:SAM-dependent methyltransferase